MDITIVLLCMTFFLLMQRTLVLDAGFKNLNGLEKVSHKRMLKFIPWNFWKIDNLRRHINHNDQLHRWNGEGELRMFAAQITSRQRFHRFTPNCSRAPYTKSPRKKHTMSLNTKLWSMPGQTLSSWFACDGDSSTCKKKRYGDHGNVISKCVSSHEQSRCPCSNFKEVGKCFCLREVSLDSNRCVGETVSASWKQWANSTWACACVKSSIEHCQPPVEFSAGSLTCGWLSPNLLVERDKILHCLTATGCRLQAFRARSIFANTTYDTLIYFDNSQNTWTLKLKAFKDAALVTHLLAKGLKISSRCCLCRRNQTSTRKNARDPAGLPLWQTHWIQREFVIESTLISAHLQNLDQSATRIWLHTPHFALHAPHFTL
jgi:hypothetical protein